MAIGAAFPPELQRASIVRQLSSGVVIKHRAKMDDERVHEKRFIVIRVNDEYVDAFVMNTELHPLVIAECQLRLEHEAFITDLCHLDCGRVRRFDYAEVVRQLVATPAWILGRIDRGLRDDIQRAFADSPLIPDADKTIYFQSLEQIQFPDNEDRAS